MVTPRAGGSALLQLTRVPGGCRPSPGGRPDPNATRSGDLMGAARSSCMAGCLSDRGVCPTLTRRLARAPEPRAARGCRSCAGTGRRLRSTGGAGRSDRYRVSATRSCSVSMFLLAVHAASSRRARPANVSASWRISSATRSSACSTADARFVDERDLDLVPVPLEARRVLLPSSGSSSALPSAVARDGRAPPRRRCRRGTRCRLSGLDRGVRPDPRSSACHPWRASLKVVARCRPPAGLRTGRVVHHRAARRSSSSPGRRRCAREMSWAAR